MEYEFKDGKVLVSAKLDSNKDGQPSAKLSLEIDLTEMSEEALHLILKKKAAK